MLAGASSIASREPQSRWIRRAIANTFLNDLTDQGGIGLLLLRGAVKRPPITGPGLQPRFYFQDSTIRSWLCLKPALSCLKVIRL